MIDAEFKISSLRTELKKSQIEKEKLVDVTNTDPLTGLLNRRGAEAAYSRLVNQSRQDNNRRLRYGFDRADSQILIIDVDNFKTTNDTYGHIAGDELLVAIAEILTANTRQNHVIPDVVSRLGGDEFLILMYGAPRQIAEDHANAIREEVRDLAQANPILNSSVSIGIGAVDLNLSLPETIHLADQALLKAKRDGKDVVVHFDEMSDQPKPKI